MDEVTDWGDLVRGCVGKFIYRGTKKAIEKRNPTRIVSIVRDTPKTLGTPILGTVNDHSGSFLDW